MAKEHREFQDFYLIGQKMSIKEISISGRKIGKNHKPFIIAEMSGNHNGDLKRALQIVESAAKSGADAIKFQTYTASTMTLNIKEGEFLIDNKSSLWSGRNLYDLYEQAHTPWQWHKELFDFARKLGLIPFSSPFDASAVDFLEELGCPCYKIASFEIIDIPLIKKAASTGKPLIMSTGMAQKQEIAEALTAAQSVGCKNIILLKCTSTYPALPTNANITTIPSMSEDFSVPVGLSDHTLGIGVAIASIALGAVAIEKHFTLDRNDGGVDSAFSLEPEELKNLVVESERAWQSLGKVTYGCSRDEEKSLQYRRSLYVVEHISKGEKFSNNNIKSIRPGLGLLPKYIDEIIGKHAACDLKKGTALKREFIK